MKQLLQTCESDIIAGLHNRAYAVITSKHDGAIHATTVQELFPPPSRQEDSKDNGKGKDEITPDANEIQAVAMFRHGTSDIWCAVARYNKSLALYCISGANTGMETTPTTVHWTSKRVSCLAFATVPSRDGEKENSLPLIVAGDLAGDATAFSLSDESKSASRRLLGHTASMLTGVHVVSDDGILRILTSDRDEKVRISSFPQTFCIDGFLLGHTAFVSSMDVARDSGCTKCVTCGGDNTVRLWDYQTCQELAVVSTNSTNGNHQTTIEEDPTAETRNNLVPTRVAISPDGITIAVIHDASWTIDILRTTNNNTTLDLCQTIDCTEQPLGITFSSNKTILVLTREPLYMVAYQADETNRFHVATTEAGLALQQVATAESISMPRTIMETDKTGQLKMEKLKEHRGWVEPSDKPWNKVERVQKARDASSRRKRRKRDQGDDPDGASDDE